MSSKQERKQLALSALTDKVCLCTIGETKRPTHTICVSTTTCSSPERLGNEGGRKQTKQIKTKLSMPRVLQNSEMFINFQTRTLVRERIPKLKLLISCCVIKCFEAAYDITLNFQNLVNKYRNQVT